MTYTTQISAQDVSIVIQGAIFDTKKQKVDAQFIEYLEKAISIFIGCEFIVSTWEFPREIYFGLCEKYPQVNFVLNADVGPIIKIVDDVPIVTNVNRMIFSTISGLREVNRKYAIKLRTDSFLYNDSILQSLYYVMNKREFFGLDLEKRNERYRIFDHHVINCNLFARNPRSHLPFLYHPGDIFLAGLTKDLIKLFNIPLATEDLIKKCNSVRNTCFMKLVPEQYIWVQCIKISRSTDTFDYSNFTYDEKEIEKSEQYYLNNFVPYTAEELGFCWPKHREVYFNKGSSSIYDHEDWHHLYHKYIDGFEQPTSYAHKKRSVVIFFMKMYFFIRSSLLKIKFIRKFAYKVFVKRG